MFFCTDVHYDDAADTAIAAAIGFWHSAEERPACEHTRPFTGLAPYVPGEFYQRELPCLVGLLEDVSRGEELDLVLVDGHAWLRPGQPGLGHHLWTALGQRVPVIGVAKAAFRGGLAHRVLRGRSRRPLWVSSVGVEAGEAADFVQRMHGDHRIPTLIAAVDALSRGRR